jgi:hypothetical protein
LAFEFGINAAFGYRAHVPNVAQSWPSVNPNR